MNAFRYYYGSTWKTWEGGTVDLTSYKPAGAGNWAWVVIGIDPVTNTATATTGPAVSVATDLTYTMVNNVPFEGIPVAAVKVRNDQSSILDMSLFADVHEWFAGLHYSKLGDLGDVNESAGYYGVGPYSNDNLYFYGAGGYEWVTGGHKINMGAVKQLTLSSGVVDLSDGPTFGFIDLIGEGSADDDLIGILNGRIGDMVALHVSDPATNGEITVKNNANFDIEGDIILNSTSDVLLLVYTDSGWCQPFRPPLVNANVTVPKSFEMYVDVKERLLENQVHGGLDSLATAQPLNSVPTDINVTAGISKLMIVVNAGSDFDGTITVTGTSVDRNTGTETPADTDNIVVDALSTDSSSTDTNGNVTHAYVGAYITSKWFKGAVVLSTTNLTLTDVDVFQISFEQFGDSSDIELDSIDATALATNASAWMDLHAYSVQVTGSKVNVTKEATLELTAAEVSANNRYRKRLGNLSVALDGTTDGIFLDAFWGPLANIYWEDLNVKVWYKHQIDVLGDMVPGYYTNYIDFNVDYADGVAEGRLQWNIEDGTLEVGLPGGTVNLQIGQEMMIRCRNTTGATILNGSAVYMTGASGNKPLIALADASDSNKIAVIGLATEDIGHNSNGYVTTRGLVRELNTNGLGVGSIVYLSESTPGAFTTTRPTAPDWGIIIGAVIADHVAQGVIGVRVTALPRILTLSDVLTAAPADGEYLAWSNANSRFELTTAPSGGVTDHGALTGLGDDDHSIYALLAGRAGGQTLYGDTASGGNLTLGSTAHATKGKVIGLGDLEIQTDAGTLTVEGNGVSANQITGTSHIILQAGTSGTVQLNVNASDVAMRVDAASLVGLPTIDASYKLNVTGAIQSSGKIEAAADTNTTSKLGRAAVGYMGSTDFASFAHVDNNTSANFALYQHGNGYTFLNAKAAQKLYFGHGGTQEMTLDENGHLGIGTITITGNLTSYLATGDHYHYIQNSASGTGTGNGLMWGIQSTPAAFLYQYENNPFYIGQNATVAIYLASSQMGVWTATPSRVLDVNQGAGNMIADGYDNHSTPEFKDFIQDMNITGALARVKGHKPKTWKRQPFVSTEELYKLAADEFDLPLAHGRESRDWMAGLEPGPELAFVAQERARLRAERAGNPKYTSDQYGLVADSSLGIDFPEIAIYEVDGDASSPIAGYNVNAYVAMLHAAIIELSEQVEALT
jgi:hypothetical protein